MSMDSTAIQRIEELVSGGLLNEDTPAITLPSGCKVESLEHLQKRPGRMRVKYQTERLEDFTNYVNDEAEHGETVCFVRPDGRGATAIIDYGTHRAPMWRDHKAVLKMEYTPEFQALYHAAADTNAYSQRALTDFIEDWQHLLGAEHAGESMPIANAVQAIRKVDVKATAKQTHEDDHYRGARSSMEEVEASSGEGNLPGFLTMPCKVFPGTAERTIRVRLALRTSDDKPVFTMRIVGLDALMQEVAEEVEEKLRAELAEGMRVYIGEV